LCTFHTAPGYPARGHWIFESPFADPLRRALIAGAAEAGHPGATAAATDTWTDHVFNTRAEIGGLAACGVTAVSQKAAAEAVLCGEAELPYALLGYTTDYANGVSEEPTPVEELLRLIERSSDVFASTLAAALPALGSREGELPAPSSVYRFED
jgi:5'-methylthioadenosine phosphorylase